MIRFAGVIALGGVAFLLLALPATREGAPGESSVAAAEGVVREFLLLGRHLKASGGDPRIAERIPAAPRLVQEALDESAYARGALGVAEQGELLRMVVVASKGRVDGVVEVATREYWVFRRRSAARDAPPLKPISAVVRVVYEVGLEAGRWVVLDFRIEPEGARSG